MKIPDKFREYIWLVNTIRSARRITLAEINARWLESGLSDGVELARSTFARHKEAIQDIFGIYIECDRQNGYCYYIVNEEVFRGNTVQNWMLSTLSVNNIISESLSLQHRILLESVPYEGDYLKMVIEAMKSGVKLEVSYLRYGVDEPRRAIMEPYCIKLFKKRWYVLGHFHNDATTEGDEVDYFALYSFDRIVRMSLTTEKFRVNPDFDAQAYFAECYGVLVGDGTQVERVVVRAYGYERYYMRDLPLHRSQQQIGAGEDYVDFELVLRPTGDFCAHLLSRGNRLKVLCPQWLADQVHTMHLDAAAMYAPDSPE